MAEEGGEMVPMDFPTHTSPAWSSPSRTILWREAKLNYRLIFKNPESGKSVALMDVISVDEDAAVARFKNIAGYMEGELWHGETQVKVIAPEPMQLARS